MSVAISACSLAARLTVFVSLYLALLLVDRLPSVPVPSISFIVYLSDAVFDEASIADGGDKRRETR